MKHIRYAAILGALGIAACAGDRAPAHHVVEIRDLSFAPDTIRAAAGDTITWANLDIVPHTVAAAGAWDSGAIAAGAEYRLVVSGTGGMEYTCAYHPMMKGWIVPR